MTTALLAPDAAAARPLPAPRAILAFRADRHATTAALRAGVAVFLALAGVVAAGRTDLSAYAVFGAFSVLYGRGLHLGDRTRMQAEAGAVLVASTLVGGLVALSPHRAVLEVPVTALWAALTLALSRRRAWNPPGALFPTFALSAVAARAPAGYGDLPIGLTAAVAAVGLAFAVGLTLDRAAAHLSRLTGRAVPPTSPRPAPMVLGREDVAKSGLLAAATAVAGLFAAAAGLGHGYWAMVTVVAALSAPDAPRKVLRSAHRGLGSLVGTLLALLVHETETALRPPLLAVLGVVAALQVGAELFVTRNYGAAVVFVTPLAVTMTWLGAGPDTAAVADRLVETGVGLAAAALVVVPLALRAPRARRTR